ncbi:MAG: PCRF domain-containing protein, partial [Clostridia bacterium]|nr:PCRF domain-containing protein [Clostridia bacterium]
MHFNLDEAEAEVKKLEETLESPDLWNDPESSQKLMQQIKQYRDKIGRFTALKQSWEDALTLTELGIEMEDDSVYEEAKEAYEKVCQSFSDLRIETLLSGEYDKNNAILTLHAGAGGTEAQDWAQMLYRMYMRWAERRGFRVQTIDYLDGDEAGLKSATILIEGLNAYGYARGEKGVHRLVRISPFDSSG